MEYKIASSADPYALTNKVNELISKGWKSKGSHKVVETLRQHKYTGSTPARTEITLEYTQTLIKDGN